MEISKDDNGKSTVSVCPNNHICHYWNNRYKEKIDNGNFGLLHRREDSNGSCIER